MGNWTVDHKRGTDGENVMQFASTEAAARDNYAKLTTGTHPDDPQWVELRSDGVPIERWDTTS